MNQTMNYVFDAAQHEPDAGFDALPAATYNVQIDSTEVATIKTQEGEPAKGETFIVGFVVTDGEYKGRKLFNRYNLWHKLSPQTCEIAHKQLSALCHVTNVFKVDFNNSGMALKGAKLRVRVDNDGKYNSVKEVFDTAGNKPSRAGAGGAAPSTAPVATATPGQGWGQTAPVATATPPAAAPAAPAVPAAFPPAGWTAHPTAPGYFYQGQEVLTEAQLRERVAPPAAPAFAPAAPTAPAVPATPAQPPFTPGSAAATPPWGAK